MKVAITYYEGNPFAPGFPSKRTKEFESLEKVKEEFKPESENVQVKARLLTAWLSIEDGERQGECCWLEDLLQGKDFHPFDRTRDVKAGESIRVIDEHGKCTLLAPLAGLKLALGYQIPLLPINNLQEGKYLLIAPSGARATAEFKKPVEGSFEQPALEISTTSLDDRAGVAP